MELWDVYDVDRQKTGRTAQRGADSLRKGEYHLSVHVVIKDSRGRLLLQRRTLDKEDWPGCWDIAAAAGSALAGENSREAAARELYEELGIQADFTDLAPYMSINLVDCFGDWYIISMDLEPDSLCFQPGEVMDARWADRDEAMALLKAGKMVDYYPGFIGLLYETDGKRGAVRSWEHRWTKKE